MLDSVNRYLRGTNVLMSRASIVWCRLRRKMCHLRRDARGVTRWSNVMATKKVLPVLARRFKEDEPPAVNIEITTDCNYACPFCPQSSYRRSSRYMTPEAFSYVVDELRRMDFSGLIVPAVNNEPFMHESLMSFCEQIALRLPRANCLLLSNGSLITFEHLRFLASLPRPPSILVNDYTENHMVACRIRGMLGSLDTRFAPSLNVEVRERSRAEKLSNRAGNQGGCTSVLDDYQDVVCTWPFTGVFLAPDLKTFLCCSDYRHQVMMGDLKEKRLMDIWRGEPYRDLRRKMLDTCREGLSLCERCDAEWFCLPPHCANER